MVSRAEYDRSILDRDRLTRYAQRVARETRQRPRERLAYAFDRSETVTVHGKRLGIFPTTTQQQVTKEVTREAIGKHWVLLSERGLWKESGDVTEDTQLSTTSLVLLPTGQIKAVTTLTTAVYQWKPYRLLESTGTHQVREPTEEQLCDLDFEREARETSRAQGRERVVARRTHRVRLIRHAKGVGVNLALKAILEGSP